MNNSVLYIIFFLEKVIRELLPISHNAYFPNIDWLHG